MITYADRLEWAMKCAGLNPQSDQSELARRVGDGCKPQNIQYLLNHNNNAKSSKYTQHLADVLACDAGWLAYGKGVAPVPREAAFAQHNSTIPDASINAQEGGKIVKLPLAGRSSISSEPIESTVGDRLELREGRSVAIVGEVQGGSDGYISIDDYPAGHGHSHLPEVRSRDAGAYGLKVRGDSMRPRIKSGEYIAVEPNVEAQPGDDVVVKFLDGSCVVKELLWIRDGDVCLGSINNGVPPITRPMTEIVHIHRVAAIMPRGSAIEA